MSSNTILGLEWNLSPDGINLITNNGALKDPKQCLKTALDSDLKSIGRPALPNLTSNSKMVLQIAKIRNVAAPKANEQSQAAPRMLKLTLTDGDGYVQAIEIGQVTALSRDKTAPGTKCLVDCAKFIGGFLLINNNNFKVLGGHVEHLYDKWQVAKSVTAHHLIIKSGGAPPWVPFGHKLAPKLVETASKESKNIKDEASEFELQRKEAIMEVSSGAVKKTFNGRVRQNVVSMPQQQKYVKNARKSFRTDDMVEHEERPQRPSEKVSLFAFLEDKLPQKPAEKSTSTTKQLPQYNLEKQQRNNYEYKQNGFVATQQNNYSQPRNVANNYPDPIRTAHSHNNYQKPYQDGYGKQSNYSKNNNAANSYQKPRSVTTEEKSEQHNVHNNNQKSNQEGYGKYSNYSKINTVASSYQKPRSVTTEEKQEQQNVHNNYQKPNQEGHGKYSNYSKINNVASSYQKPKSVTTEEKQEQQNVVVIEDRQQNSRNNHNVAKLANNMSKMSINSEFATRTLRNHLNLPTTTQAAPSVTASMNVGDQCMAKYWEDGKFYPASIAAVTERTYAVRFQGYGNIEEVLKQDCFVAGANQNNYQQQQRNFQGNSLEYRNKRRNYND